MRVLPFQFCNPTFSSRFPNLGNTVARVEDAPPTQAVSVVEATTSQISSGSALPQEKLKIAHKLLGVSKSINSSTYLLLD